MGNTGSAAGSFVLGACLSGWCAAQEPVSASNAPRPERTLFEVTAQGAGTRNVHVAPRPSAAPSPSAGSSSSSPTAASPSANGPAVQTVVIPAGELWRHNDPFWIGRIVSIGNRGTQVFSEFDTNSDHAEFLSGFDMNPPTPVWGTPLGADLAQAQCDSAETDDTHVTIHQIVVNGDQLHRQAVVSHYASSSSVPDWTYAFPQLVGSASKVRMSADGRVIVAAIHDNWTNQARLAFFDSASGIPVATHTLGFVTQLRGFELSADGSTLYVSSATQAVVLDVATRATLLTVALPTALDCHAISGDGRVVAYGTFGTVEIWERNQGGGYSHTWSQPVPGTNVCARVALSTNGATLVYGFNFYDTNLHVRIEALDVPSKTVTMSDDAWGAGTLQNVVGDLAIDASGESFVAGLWGDAAGQCPELRMYRKHQSAPARLVDLPGSVFDVDMSADGERIAVASKALHANTLAFGGSLGLYSFERQDLRALGVPVAGARLHFQMRGPAWSPAVLLWSDGAAATPVDFPTIGTLYLRRTGLNLQPAGAADSDGFVEVEFPLPAGASDIGRTLCFQGFYSTPRHLTGDWAAVTILP